MKPIDLFEYLIGNSTKEGDTVLDMFGGSGTTLLACERTNRRCLMMELDPKYCEVIIQRWEELTGRKAVEV
jgi:site-specific DNA-methyltransferase (adenine-specific)